MADASKKTVNFRNPVYILYMLFGAIVFLIAADMSSRGVGTLEAAIFRSVNALPEWLFYPFLVISTFGALGMVLLLAIFSLIKKRYKAAAKYIIAGGGAYAAAYAFKLLEIRARPGELLANVNIRELAIEPTFGFPSGHVATATALALITYAYTPKKYHRYISGMVVLVAISRMYLGMHLPMDLFGGFALGLFIGSAVSYAFGRRIVARVTVSEVTRALKKMKFPVKKVAVLGVDARGSSPFIVEGTDNKKYFLKVVNKDNFVADWLFKMWRKVVYRRLEDENPFLSPKRQIEHESYVAGLAYANGIKTPRIVGVLEVKPNNWAQIQEAIDGKSLDKVDPKLVTDKVLYKVFELVQHLHEVNIIHRDLRAANIFLDSKNEPWLIDFGFSEASIREEQTYRDLVEMIASLGVIVGSKRVVAAAVKHIPKEHLVNALAYMNYPSMSSETTRLLKLRKKLLPEITSELKKALKIEEVKLVKLNRFSIKNLLIILGVALFIYFIVSQKEDFKNSISAIRDADINMLLLSFVFSMVTYFAASMVYKLIAIYPLPYFRTLLVQVSSSFTNRLLPAGTGGLATFARYLVTQGHTKPQAAALATINNLFGFLGITLLTVTVALVSHTPLREAIKFPIPSWVFIVAGSVIVAAITIAVVVKPIGAMVVKAKKSLIRDFKLIAANPVRLVFALLFSMLITVSYAAVLFVATKAMGESITILQTFIVLTIGVAAASVTPTPGGIGGAEAGLVAGLSSVGIPTDVGLSIALVYRFATFWLPIIPGFIAFQIALRKKVL